MSEPVELFRVEGLWAAPAPDPAFPGVVPAPILTGLDLAVAPGEVHAIMGPNGSGKSTLASTLMGSPEYEVRAGTVTYQGDDVTNWPADERAKAGMFLAFQYPQEIPGVTVTNFLRTAKTAIDGEAPAIRTWTKDVKQSMKNLRMDPKFASRNVNEGFSGGEKKRHEILQLELLKPQIAVLDELKPDHVHVMVDGRIVTSGGMEIAETLERDGYEVFREGGTA